MKKQNIPFFVLRDADNIPFFRSHVYEYEYIIVSLFSAKFLTE